MRRTRQMLLSRSRKTAILFLLVFFLAGMLMAGCRKKQEIQPVEVIKPVKIMTIEAGTQQESLSLPGKVRAARRSELSFKVSGPLQLLPIEEGQVVKKGELIAQINPRDFQVAVEAAKARAVEAENQYNRYKELYAKRQVSKSDFDKYKAARDIARAELADARNALKDTRLTAPFDGVIAKRYVENFEKVQEKQPIAFLQSIEQLEILVDVPELMMARFRDGKETETVAEFDAAPGKKYPLALKEFSTQADPATRTYQVVLSMKQPKEVVILPGMTAKVIVSTLARGRQTSEGVVIPAIAVLNGANDVSYVWLYDKESQSAHKVPVKVGPITGSDGILVKEGLKAGDVLIVAGVTKLREGMKVRPWEKQREGK